MRTATIVSLGVSGLLGLGALVTAKVFLPSGDSEKTAAAPLVETVPVVVAAKALGYGASLTPQDLTVVQLPKAAAPEGAYAAVDQVFLAGGAPLALAPLAMREPILPAKLSTGGARLSVAAAITPGMRAYTVRVTDVSGVGGHALPGDRVDVVLMRDARPEAPKDGRKAAFLSEVLLQDIKVLAVNHNADPASTEAAAPQTATLEVAVAEAQKLSIASDLGVLSLALRRTGASEKDAVRTIASSEFSGGGAPRARAARTSARSRGPAPAPGSALTIVSGSERVAMRVPSERGL